MQWQRWVYVNDSDIVYFITQNLLQLLKYLQCHNSPMLVFCVNTWHRFGPHWDDKSPVMINKRNVLIPQTANVSLTFWGRATHICVSKLTIIGSDNGLSPGRRQAIIWSNARILLIGLLVTHFSGILIEILIFSFTKMRLKVSSVKWWPFYLGLNELNFLVHTMDVIIAV